MGAVTGALLPCSFAKGALSRILPGWRTGNKVIQAPGALGKMREGRKEERERGREGRGTEGTHGGSSVRAFERRTPLYKRGDSARLP